jgi:hypothetical protein
MHTSMRLAAAGLGLAAGCQGLALRADGAGAGAGVATQSEPSVVPWWDVNETFDLPSTWTVIGWSPAEYQAAVRSGMMSHNVATKEVCSDASLAVMPDMFCAPATPPPGAVIAGAFPDNFRHFDNCQVRVVRASGLIASFGTADVCHVLSPELALCHRVERVDLLRVTIQKTDASREELELLWIKHAEDGKMHPLHNGDFVSPAPPSANAHSHSHARSHAHLRA